MAVSVSRRLFAVAAAAAVLAGGVVAARAGGNDAPPAATPAGEQAPVPAAVTTTVPPTTTTSTPPPPPPGERVDARGPRLEVFDTPGAPSPSRMLSNPTWEGVPLVLHGVSRRDDWIQVRVNQRPNGTLGWVRAADVTTTPLDVRVVVDRAAHLLRVFRGHDLVLEEPVAVGTDRTPTPTGAFYIDAVVENQGGIWGAYQLSVAGFSEVYTKFLGGIGQIAIHGTNAPQLIGRSISNGCVRMRNDSITRLAAAAPLGTSVEIV